MAKTKMMKDISDLYGSLLYKQSDLKALALTIAQGTVKDETAAVRKNLRTFKKNYRKYDADIDDLIKKIAALETYMGKWKSDKHWKNAFKNSKKMTASKNLVITSLVQYKAWLRNIKPERDSLKMYVEGADLFL